MNASFPTTNQLVRVSVWSRSGSDKQNPFSKIYMWLTVKYRISPLYMTTTLLLLLLLCQPKGQYVNLQLLPLLHWIVLSLFLSVVLPCARVYQPSCFRFSKWHWYIVDKFTRYCFKFWLTHFVVRPQSHMMEFLCYGRPLRVGGLFTRLSKIMVFEI